MPRFISLKRSLQRLKDFARGERGMTLPLLAVSMVAITGMVGIAIDTARMQLVQSKLQFSLDAAGLAAGSTVSTANLNTEVTKYMNANFNGYLGASLLSVTASVDSTNTIITLTATASLPTTFMAVVEVQTITLTVHSQISRAVTGLEMVMVLDNTGSMTNSAGGSQSKIDALKAAANTLITSMFAGNPPEGKLWVGVVPFSQSVNIGTGHPAWMDTTYDNALASVSVLIGNSWGTTSWGGCVDARLNGEDVTDTPPALGVTSTLFRQYYWPSDNVNYGSPYNNTPNSGNNNWAQETYQRCKVSNPSNCTTKYGSGSCSTSHGTYTCTFTGYTPLASLDTTTQGPNLDCPQQVTLMTNVKDTLTTNINAMTAQGNTEINEGLAWGWRMLSPRWQGQWGGTMNANGLPLAYGAHGMNKAVILMTDGVNTISDGSHGSYWFLHNGLTGSTSSSGAVTKLNNKTAQLCTAMKNQGIYIYTIALGTDVTTDSLALLENCATAKNYFFQSPSTSQLQGVFNAIGDSLSNLRVSR